MVKPFEITINQAAEIVRRSPLETPVMVWGNTGLGKSEVMHDTAASADLSCLTEIAQIRSQVDFSGIPMIEELTNEKGETEAFTKFTRPIHLPHAHIHGESGLWLLDEFPNAMRSVQAATQSILTRGQYNEYSWPPGWKIVLAGNQMDHGAQTYEMPRPIRNRVMHLYVRYDAETFVDWGGGQPQTLEQVDKANLFPSGRAAAEKAGFRVHPVVRAFLSRVPEMIFVENDGVDAIATPRSWEHASWVLYLIEQNGLPKEMADVMLQGLIGPAAHAEFSVFQEDASLLPHPRDILDGKAKIEKQGDPAVTYVNGKEITAGQLYALSTSLATVVKTTDDMLALFGVVENISASECQMICIKDVWMRHKHEVTKLKEFTKWAAKFKEKLIR